MSEFINHHPWMIFWIAMVGIITVGITIQNVVQNIAIAVTNWAAGRRVLKSDGTRVEKTQP